MSFINFARILLTALDGGRDATTGKVFCLSPSHCGKARSATSTR